MLTVFLISCTTKTTEKPKYIQGSYEADWSSLADHETPQWFEDAVLEFYFHWGPYSVPAFGCWGGRNMYMPDGGTSENWRHVEDQYEKPMIM